MKIKKIKQKKVINHIDYLKESKKAILFVVLVFIFSIILGIIYADYISELITPLLKDIIDKTEDLSLSELIVFIFYNNALTSLLGLFLGIFAAFIPVIIAFTNGIVLGYVLERTINIAGISELWLLFPHGIFELPAIFISLGVGAKLGKDILKNYMAKNKTNITKLALGITSLFLALFGILIFRIVVASPIIQAIFTIISLLFIAPFVLLFFILDKKIRKFNVERIKASLKIFLLIIIPLLVIASIIEGILIMASP